MFNFFNKPTQCCQQPQQPVRVFNASDALKLQVATYHQEIVNLNKSLSRKCHYINNLRGRIKELNEKLKEYEKTDTKKSKNKKING